MYAHQMERRRFQFSRDQRIRSSADFERIYEHGRRAGDGHVLMFAMTNGSEVSRLGLSVSRKHGTAVHRNRKRRLLREAFRLSQHQLPAGMDFVVIPRQRDDSSRDDYVASIVRLARRLAERSGS